MRLVYQDYPDWTGLTAALGARIAAERLTNEFE
jgi:hypothetical protein